MRPGPLIRKLFGPYEHGVAEAYRRIFIDLDDFAKVTRCWVPDANRILEVGCGEGAMTERIVRTYPNAIVTSIDITPNVGRLYRGPKERVTFRQETIEALAAREPATYDLVILADVMHHVPREIRDSLMAAIRQALAPSGSLVLKDWIVSKGPIHWLCDSSDRYLTGDDVSYFTPESLRTLVAQTFGNPAIRKSGTIRPWGNNVALLVRP
jgi:2-polyprenyl-3-methyl-5-hydroxy-6-metoxy-1,4-benzoquinol methylase